MGTKRALASEVASLCREAKEGAFLDLFSGMCAVATSLGETRPVWSNDLQIFATTVAEVNFCLVDPPLEGMTAYDLLRKDFAKNEALLLKKFGLEADEEDTALNNLDIPTLQLIFERRIENACALANQGKYDVFVNRFAAAYFSVRQCIEIDSLIFAIEKSKKISESQKQWLKVALAVAISRCTTSRLLKKSLVSRPMA